MTTNEEMLNRAGPFFIVVGLLLLMLINDCNYYCDEWQRRRTEAAMDQEESDGV